VAAGRIQVGADNKQVLRFAQDDNVILRRSSVLRFDHDHSLMAFYRSGEPLRHPKTKTTPTTKAKSTVRRG
jgi:hypothetical protein